MEQCGFRDQQIRDRCAVPHSMVMGQILLEAKRAVKMSGGAAMTSKLACRSDLRAS
jgi:hypothetical protein